VDDSLEYSSSSWHSGMPVKLLNIAGLTVTMLSGSVCPAAQIPSPNVLLPNGPSCQEADSPEASGPGRAACICTKGLQKSRPQMKSLSNFLALLQTIKGYLIYIKVFQIGSLITTLNWTVSLWWCSVVCQDLYPSQIQNIEIIYSIFMTFK
jgi:hypothetical protein